MKETLANTTWSKFLNNECVFVEDTSYGVSLCDMVDSIKLTVVGINNDFDRYEYFTESQDGDDYRYLMDIYLSACSSVEEVQMFP